MKYLKTYKSVNESTLGDLSFEDFQDLFVDITDKYDDFEYYKQSNFYEIRIICELPDFLLNKDFVDVINNEKSELESINKQIDKMLKITELVKEIKEVIKRLLKFDNCLEIQTGLYKSGTVNKWKAEITLQYIIR